jgi:hypothetical protein
MQEKRKKMKETKKQSFTFSTSFVCIGTSADLAMLALNKEEFKVRQINY